MEQRAAHDAFEAFGARWWAERTSHPPAHEGDGAPAAAPPATAATFRCHGDTRELCFGSHRVVLRDLLGFRYLARLLAEPSREFHVLDLVAVERGSLPTGGPERIPGSVAAGTGDGLPVLDDRARAAYRRRLADAEEDIEDADRMNDPARRVLAERDREYIVAELARAIGLGGRERTTGGSAQRARTSVARSIRYALARMGEHHGELAGHLAACVRTGTYCSYVPDPLAPVRWEL